MNDPAGIANTTGAFPNVISNNATGAGLTDGTPYTKAFIDDYVFGAWQAFLDYAGINPNGITEAAGASQILESIEKGFAVGPGKLVGWFLDDDPSVTGDRVLLLEGQGVLASIYPEITTACAVADGSNTATQVGGGAFYRASDAAGTTPLIGGNYLILPEARGYVPRGLDIAAAIDPDGATRFVGDNQADAGQVIQAYIPNIWSGDGSSSGAFTSSVSAVNRPLGAAEASSSYSFDSSTSTSPNPAKTNDVETRVSNFSIRWGITY